MMRSITRRVDEATMCVCATQLAKQLSLPIIMTLSGELGAGKTTFVRALLRGLGIQDVVKSPTYTLLEVYHYAAGTVYHLDLYRLQEAEELEFLGIREVFLQPSLLLVEWPEHGASYLPQPDVSLQLAVKQDARELTLQAHSRAGDALLISLPSPG